MRVVPSLFGRRARAAARPSCPRCGRIVGLFGPIWIEHRDGSVEPGSWQFTGEERRATAVRAYHAGCFVPDFVPDWLRAPEPAAEPPRADRRGHRSFRLSTTRWTALQRASAAALSLACATVTSLDLAS